MNAASILGYGAIGLGLLLAILCYRLLAKTQAAASPIYIFMLFCFALVVVGAFLQYTDSVARAEVVSKQADAELRSAKASLDSAQDQIKRLRASMKHIVDVLTETDKPLKATLGFVADGGACPGGAHGIPMPHGADAASQISTVQTKVAGAISTANQYAQ